MLLHFFRLVLSLACGGLFYLGFYFILINVDGGLSPSDRIALIAIGVVVAILAYIALLRLLRPSA